MKYGFIFALILSGIFVFVHPVVAGDHWLGMGVHYWEYVNDIEIGDMDDFDESGASWVVSYRYKPAVLGLQLDLEFADNQVGAIDDWTYSPQAFVIAGSTLYGGLGIGVHYADGDTSDPFYALKAGLVFEILPHIQLDVNANYRFEEWDVDAVEEDLDTDTITLGGVVRFEF
jgi:hypothetical protein